MLTGAIASIASVAGGFAGCGEGVLDRDSLFDQTTTLSQSAPMGPQGGVIQLEEGTFALPQGALSQNTTVTLMRVKDGANYVLVGSTGGAPKNPVWVNNLRADPRVELRDLAVVRKMRVREVSDAAERERLWKAAVAAYPPYAEYQTRTTRIIPIFVAEPLS